MTCYLLKLWYISGMVFGVLAALFFQIGHQGTERVANNRDIKRIKKRISIRFGIDEAVRLAFTEDISMTGMFIKTPNIIPPTQGLKSSLTSPKEAG